MPKAVLPKLWPDISKNISSALKLIFCHRFAKLMVQTSLPLQTRAHLRISYQNQFINLKGSFDFFNIYPLLY